MSIPVNDPNWVEPEAEVRLADESVYCVCRTRDDGSFMINCDFCQDWFHGRCVGIRERVGDLVDVFVCPNCTAAGKGVTKWKSEFRQRLATPVLEGSQPSSSVVADRKRPLPSSPTTPHAHPLSGSDPKRPRLMTEEERAAVAEQKRRQQEAQQRKIREEMALKKKREMEERRRAAEEKERLHQQRLRQSRETQDAKRNANANVLAQYLQTGLDNDKKQGAVNEEVAKTWKGAQALAKEIEEALFAHHKDINKDYGAFFRSLVFNLKDEKNTSLRERLFKGDLPAKDLVLMDSKDLANTEIMQYRKEKEKELFAEVYKGPENDLVIRKTHKGLEVPEEFLDSAPSAGQKKSPEHHEDATEEGAPVKHEDSTILTPPSTPMRLSRDGNIRSSGEGDNLPSTPSNLQPEVPATPTRPVVDVAEVEFNLGINFEDDEDIEFPEEEEEENPVEEIVDDRDRRIKKEHFKASKGRVTEDSEKSEKPSVWKGTFTYKFQDIDVRFDAEAEHLCGPDVEHLFPNFLDIGFRMNLDQLLTYIPQLKFSSSRACTCVLLKSAQGEYKKLFSHLRTTERSGVVQVGPNNFPGLHTFFKEVYVFPLAASDPDPDFLTEQGFERDLEDMLIGVLITDKKQTIPSTVPAATGPGTSPGGAHYSSSDVYVPPVKEEKASAPAPSSMASLSSLMNELAKTKALSGLGSDMSGGLMGSLTGSVGNTGIPATGMSAPGMPATGMPFGGMAGVAGLGMLGNMPGMGMGVSGMPNMGMGNMPNVQMGMGPMGGMQGNMWGMNLPNMPNMGAANLGNAMAGLGNLGNMAGNMGGMGNMGSAAGGWSNQGQGGRSPGVGSPGGDERDRDWDRDGKRFRDDRGSNRRGGRGGWKDRGGGGGGRRGGNFSPRGR